MRIKLINVLTVCLLSGITSADTWTVDDDGLDYPKADYSQIQAAIDAASHGDTINVYPGTYSPVYLQKSVDLIGIAGPDETIVDANYTWNVFLYDSTGGESYIEGFSFIRGYDTQQGAVIINQPMHMKDCVITKNRAYEYGALMVLGADCTFEDVLIQGNHSAYTGTAHGAGVYINSANTTFIRCTIQNNFSHRDSPGHIKGGGIYCGQLGLHIEECVISDNSIQNVYGSNLQQALGSAIYCDTPFHMDNTIVCGNIGLYNNGAQGAQIYGGYTGSGNVVNTNCDSTNQVLGACCLETECTSATAYDCGVAGGTFKGMLTTCEQVDCMDDGNYGACCVDGNCASSTQYICDSLGGSWQGKFTTCENVACTPPPAIAGCCLSDDCLTTLETICDTLGGTWQGDSSDCQSAECVSWTGACCVSGSCLDVTLDECFSASGSFVGDLSTCADGVDCSYECLGDINSDGVVNVSDLLTMISVWGACP